MQRNDLTQGRILIQFQDYLDREIQRKHSNVVVVVDHLPIQKPSAQPERLCVESAPKKDIFRLCAAVGAIKLEEGDDIFLGTVNASADTVSMTGSPWVIDLTLNGQSVQFKIDTRADITVIGEADYNQVRDGPLQSSKTTLSGPSQMPLEVLGKFQALLRHDDRETKEDVFVIKGLRQPLVGRPAITSLNLLVKVESVNNSCHV